MAWEKVSKEKCELLDVLVKRLPLEKKTMFGCPVYFANGYMLTGVHGDMIFLRLSEDGKKALTAHYPEAGAFEPMKGRIMKDYITIPGTLYSDAEAFDLWLTSAYAQVTSLPAKAKKVKSKK